ncbi:MAG: ABC transporter substrate-binding protein [Actinomycetota bacterium]
MQRVPLRVLAVLAALAMSAAACGSDSDDESGASGSEADVAAESEEAATDDGDDASSEAPADDDDGSGEGQRLIVGAQFLDDFVSRSVVGFDNPPAYSSILSQFVFDGLLELDPTQGYLPIPDLAESFEVSDDGLVYTFVLRDDVTWHDGEPFTSDDVVFTLTAALDPANQARTAADLAAVSSVTAPDEFTVVVELSRPFAPILQSLSLPIHPEHLLGAELAAGTPPGETEYAAAPVGTGPYVWTEYRPGEQLLLDANPAYHKGAPSISEAVLVDVADYDVAAARLAAGEIDLAEVSGAQLGLVDGLDGYAVNTVPSTNVFAISLNVADPLLEDPRVRIALNNLVDRQALVDLLEAGLGEPALSPLVNTSVEIETSVSLATDVEAGTALLEEAGWVKDGDTWTVDGEPVSLRLDDGFAPQMAEVVASSLRDQGIDVTLSTGDYADIFGQLFADPSGFQLFTYSFGAPTDPDSIYILFHSQATLANGGFNAFAYGNDDVDAALDRARDETDVAARAEAYADFQEAAAADPAYILLHTAPVHMVVSDALDQWDPGLVEYQLVRFMYWNVEEWTKS